MSNQPGAPVVGPFEVIDLVGAVGSPLFNRPYAEVAGANIVATVRDNTAGKPSVTDYTSFMLGAEVSFWGSVQGAWDLLKIQFVRMISGPMRIRIPTDEAYDYIEVRARMMAGGRSGGPTGSPPPISGALGFSCELTFYVQKAPVGQGGSGDGVSSRGRR